jgi:hypothetical protein
METAVIDFPEIHEVHHPPSRLRDCPVCYGPHDDEIHEATLSVHAWFKITVTQYLESDGCGGLS